MNSANQNVKRTIAVVVVGVLFLIWAAIFIYKSSFIAIDGERHFCLFDDAMISMRYAWNLAHGEGLVWNSGERVEGFTNMLMTLVMAAPSLFLSKGAAVLTVQVLGVFAMLAVAFFTMKIGEVAAAEAGIQNSWGLSLLFFAGGLVYYPLAYWALMGMETGLFSALVLASVWLVLRDTGELKFAIFIPVLLGLAFWTRPDAVVYIVVILGFRFVGLWLKPAGDKPRPYIKELAILAAFVAAISIFRLAYFGALFPNTYTLKISGVPLGFRLANGLGFIEGFIEAAAIPLLIGLVSVALKPGRAAVLLLSLVLLSIAYQIFVGGDPWLYWRFTAPFVPLLFVLVLRTAAILVVAIGRRFAPALPILLFVLAAWLINDTFEEEMVFKTRPYQVEFNHATVSAAIALNEVTTPQASVGVLWAGSIPYYTGLKAYDFLGRADRHIASLPPDLSDSTAMRGMKSLPGHNKYDLEYSIFELKPTYIQDVRWGRDDLLEKVKEAYVGVFYKGVPLTLKKGSPFVKWEEIEKGKDPSPYAGPLPGGRTSPTP